MTSIADVSGRVESRLSISRSRSAGFPVWSSPKVRPDASLQRTPEASLHLTPSASDQKNPEASLQRTPPTSSQRRPEASLQRRPEASLQRTPVTSFQRTDEGCVTYGLAPAEEAHGPAASSRASAAAQVRLCAPIMTSRFPFPFRDRGCGPNPRLYDREKAHGHRKQR